MIEDRTYAGWSREGEHIAPALDAHGAAIVLGDDPIAAAEVALGIGRVQARRRRVAVCDLVGELPSIELLVPGDSPHGLTDSFYYGVSLSRIAHPIDPARNLLVLPSGPGPIEYEAILSSERWPRLAAGFREVGALLLAIVPTVAPGVAALGHALGGAVVVGDATAPEGVPVIATARLEALAAAEPLPAVASDAEFEETLHRDVPLRVLARLTPERVAPSREMLAAERRARRAPILVAAAAAVVAVAALTTWAVARARGGSTTAAAPVWRDSSLTTAAAPAAATESSTVAGTVAAPAAPSAFGVVNASDSATAARWAVALAQVFSQSAANAAIARFESHGVPALTVAPEPGPPGEQGALFVIAGASTERTAAEGLLRDLRARGVVKPSQGHVVQAPYALLIQQGVDSSQVSFFLNGYHLKGIPAYVLAQRDGTFNLYAGAFDAPRSSRALMNTLIAGGDTPHVVYRTGRMP